MPRSTRFRERGGREAEPGPRATDSGGPAPTVVPGGRTALFLASTRGRAFRALAHAPFRLLFVAFLINQTGFWVSHLSLQGLMVELSGNDPLQLGLLFFALFVPAFALAPVAGVAADRLDRVRIMLVCYVGVAALMALLALLTVRAWIDESLVLGLGLALGVCFTFSGPASMAVAANAVSDDDLGSAISLQSAANNLTRILGPALAAPILAARRFEIAFAFFLVASLLACGLVSRARVAPYAREATTGGMLERLRGGYAHARERRPALPAIWTVAALSFFGVSHVAVLPVYAERVLGDETFFAWIVAASGLGALLGALAAGYATRPTLRAAAVQVLLYGAALALFAHTTWPWLALGAQVLVGYFYFAVMTSLQTLVQQIVDEARRGRVMSLFQVAWAGLVPFGGFAAGAATRELGVVPTLSVAAGACAAIGAGVALFAPRWSGAARQA